MVESKKLLESNDFGNPVQIEKIFEYLESFKAGELKWFENVSVMDHIANVASFSTKIAETIMKQGHDIEIHKVWLMGWLRDIGRVGWGIAEKQGMKEIVNKYGHHGYLGYDLLLNSGVSEDLAIICMTHIGSGISKEETEKVNAILGSTVFPLKDWYAKSLEEKVVVIADKIPGWNNTILAHYAAETRGETNGNKIYSWLDDQRPLWNRFWSFKKEIDELCGCDVLTLFDNGLLSSNPISYSKLPKAELVLLEKH